MMTSALLMQRGAPELSEKWLLDSRLTGKPILAQIKNSFGRAGEGWHQGKYEGERVIILTVLDTQNDLFAATARCQAKYSRIIPAPTVAA